MRVQVLNNPQKVSAVGSEFEGRHEFSRQAETCRVSPEHAAYQCEHFTILHSDERPIFFCETYFGSFPPHQIFNFLPPVLYSRFHPQSLSDRRACSIGGVRGSPYAKLLAQSNELGTPASCKLRGGDVWLCFDVPTYCGHNDTQRLAARKLFIRTSLVISLRSRADRPTS